MSKMAKKRKILVRINVTLVESLMKINGPLEKCSFEKEKVKRAFYMHITQKGQVLVRYISIYKLIICHKWYSIEYL